jgi:hypothetical protein
MQLDRDDFVAYPRVPAFPKVLHLGQFRHEGRLERPRPPCYPWRSWKK